uniref:Uncharacterized protein n=1 Tax=Lepeophtheirus salmonis TaxID=72036 RepID=A0A0K2VAE0_LEPSM
MDDIKIVTSYKKALWTRVSYIFFDINSSLVHKLLEEPPILL